MTEITLRAYIREIDKLIDQENLDEAIAHCRHLLQRHPKYIECYRLLGKAYLEAKRYGDAADIFQRVLSAVPDDFVSHIGMSIVREDEGNLDSAIWHMERAFETNPANPAIQQELKRLIGRRDGFEPHKVRLTRGALARMYAHGELYPQAIAELQSALDENNDRPDLQVLLARLLWQTDQRTEAADVSGQLIDKLPYCMQATRITAAVLQERGMSEEAAAYHRRLAQLDPYMAYTEAPMAEPVRVDADSIMVQKLDWQPGQPLPSTEAAPTDWAASLGLEDTSDTEEASTGPLPSWLDDVDSTPASPSEEPQAQPFAEPAEVEAFEGEPQEESDQEEPAAGDEGLPDWIEDAGWQEATGETEEQPVSFSSEELDQLERGEMPAEELIPSEESGELEPAEIPSWLQGMAPGGEEEDLEEDDEELEAILRGEGEPTGRAMDLEAEFEPEEAEITSPDEEEEEAQDVPAWLDEGEPGATSTIMTWLGDREEGEVPEEDLQELTEEPIPPAAEEEAEEEVPTWLSGVAQAAAETEGAEEEELAQFREQADRAQTESSELPEEAAESSGVPDWLRTITGEAEPSAEAVEPAEEDFLEEETELPWEAEVEAAEQETIPQEPGPSSEVEDEEIPSWLGALDEEEIAPPAAAESTSAAEIAEEEEVEEDWLAGLDEPEQAEGEIAEEASWLQELGAEIETGEPELSGPSWMEGLVEEEEEPSEDEVEARASSWLDDLSDTLAETPAEPEAEAPEWLDQVGEVDEAPEAAEPEMELEQPVEDEEDLAWLEDLESYDRGEGVQPEQPPPAAELDEIDEDGVFDWLDQMAAQQDQFSAGPEETAEEPAAEGEPTVSEQAPPDTFDEGLDWLDRLSETRGIDADIDREPAAGTISGRMGREPSSEEPEPEAEVTEAGRWEPEVEAEVSDQAAAEPSLAADQPEPSHEKAEESTAEEIPSWLKEEAETSASGREDAPAEPAAKPEDAPEWRQEESKPEPTPPVPDAPEPEEVPSWLQEQETADEQPEREEVPEWLRTQAEAEPEEPAAAAPSQPSEAAPSPTPAKEEEVPDWLQSEAEAAEVEAEPLQPPVAAEPEAVLPEETEPSPEPLTPEVEAEPEVEAVPMAAPPSEEAVEPAMPAPPGPETVEEVKAEETAHPPAEDDYSLGREALGEGDEAKAAQHFQNLIKERERLEEVVAALEEHLEEDPDAPSLWQILGDAYMKMERTDQAVRAYDRGMEESEVFDSARQALAGADYERAAAQYGMLIKKKKRLKVVIDDLEKAVEDDQADPRIWQVLGDAYMKDGRIDESINAYRKGMDSV